MRITHKPSGIVVQCQNERSQSSNRATAMAMLRSKLIEAEERRRKEEIARERGEAQDVNFGSQIRSYVLHPYTMVKDHRTDFEVGNCPPIPRVSTSAFILTVSESRCARRVNCPITLRVFIVPGSPPAVRQGIERAPVKVSLGFGETLAKENRN